MARPGAIVLCGDGINCDFETEYALNIAGFNAERTHVSTLLQEPAKLSAASICVLPGGFSYGDEIASGKVLGVKLKERLNETLHSFIDKGKLVLGICNGFQVLVQMGILPNSTQGQPRLVSLLRNKQKKFVDRWVDLDVDQENSSLYFKGLNKIMLPVRHGEGRLALEPSLRSVMEEHDPAHPVDSCDDNQSLIKSRAPLRYASDINGSFDRIAALTNESGNVLGMMPHPEAFVRWTQHPAWTTIKIGRAKREDEAMPDGLAILRNAAEFAARG